MDARAKRATITLEKNATLSRESAVAALKNTRYKVTSYEKK